MNKNRILSRYFREIAPSRPLTSEEEANLARRIRAGSEEARNRLVSANLKFVVQIAQEYQTDWVSLEDLIGVGNLALMTAAERFDGSRGTRFISYAVWWVRRAMQICLAQQARVVRLPQNRTDLMYRMSRASRELEQIQESTPSVEMIAANLDATESLVRDTLRLSQPSVSLDAPFEEEGRENLLDHLADADQQEPDEAVDESWMQEQVARGMDTLTEREQMVLELYFGLKDEVLTLGQIGLRLNVCRERVRQIKDEALNQLFKSWGQPTREALSEMMA